MPQSPKKQHEESRPHKGPVYVCTYNSTGEYALSGGHDRIIRLWNTQTFKEIQAFQGHGWEVHDIAIAGDNSRFASCGGDRQVFYWDVARAQTIQRYAGHTQRVNCVAFNGEASILASGSFDATVALWDCRSHNRTPIQLLKDAKDSVTSLAITTHEVLAASVDGFVRTYDLRRGKLTEDAIASTVTCIQLSSDGACLLASSLDDTLRLFDRSSGTLLSTYTGHINHDYVMRCAFMHKDAYVISGSEDGSLLIWDLLQNAPLQRLEAHTKYVPSICIHPREPTHLISASFDGTLAFWS